MNWLDYLFLAIFLVSVMLGAAKGLARMTVGLIAAVLGILFACRWYAEAGEFLQPYLRSVALAHAAGFIIVLSVFLIAGAVVGSLLATAFKWVGLSWLDRFLGAAFGAVRAILIGIAILLVGMAFPRNGFPGAIVHSKFAPHIAAAASVLAAITPHDFKSAFFANYEEVKRTWAALSGAEKRRLNESEI